jgi:sugar phosphate isomerase/epimerase
MITIALSTGSLHTYGLARVFELAADTGFDAMEVMIDHRWDSRQPAYLQRLSRETNLPIAIVHSPFLPAVPGWPHDPMGRLQETAALARQVGAAVAVAHLPLRIRGARIEFYGFRCRMLLPVSRGGDRVYRDFLLNGLAAFEAEHEIKVAVENMPAKRFLGRNVDIHWLNNLEDLPQMPHLTLDTTHIGTWGMDLLPIYERLKAHIVHVHLSNFNGKEHQLPDDGHLPLADLLSKMADDGYRHTISLELNPNALHDEDEEQVRSHLSRSLAFIREHTR